MGKSVEISQDIKKRIVQLHKSESPMTTIYRRLKAPHSVQTVVHKYGHDAMSSPHTAQEGGRFCVLNVQVDTKVFYIFTSRRPCEDAGETGETGSLSTGKRPLH